MCHIPIVLCAFLVYFRFILRPFSVSSSPYLRLMSVISPSIERPSSGEQAAKHRPSSDGARILERLSTLFKPYKNRAKTLFLLNFLSSSDKMPPTKNNQITFHFSLLGTFAGSSFPSLRTRGKPYMRPASHLGSPNTNVF